MDYIFAAGPGLSLERDEASMRALVLSHQKCDETGEWPSDHGMEAMTVVLPE